MASIRIFCAVTLVALLVLSAALTPAQKNRTRDAARHAGEAAETFTEIMNVKEKAIPKELLDTAEAIAVFPGVIKAAFLVGGRGGQGVISRRVRGGLRSSFRRISPRPSRRWTSRSACGSRSRTRRASTIGGGWSSRRSNGRALRLMRASAD